MDSPGRGCGRGPGGHGSHGGGRGGGIMAPEMGSMGSMSGMAPGMGHGGRFPGRGRGGRCSGIRDDRARSTLDMMRQLMSNGHYNDLEAMDIVRQIQRQA